LRSRVTSEWFYIYGPDADAIALLAKVSCLEEIGLYISVNDQFVEICNQHDRLQRVYVQAVHSCQSTARAKGDFYRKITLRCLRHDEAENFQTWDDLAAEGLSVDTLILSRRAMLSDDIPPSFSFLPSLHAIDFDFDHSYDYNSAKIPSSRDFSLRLMRSLKKNYSDRLPSLKFSTVNWPTADVSLALSYPDFKPPLLEGLSGIQAQDQGPRTHFVVRGYRCTPLYKATTLPLDINDRRSWHTAYKITRVCISFVFQNLAVSIATIARYAPDIEKLVFDRGVQDMEYISAEELVC
jgi:hypothetical protein